MKVKLKGYTVIMDTTLIQVKLYKVVYFHVKRKHIPNSGI